MAIVPPVIAWVSHSAGLYGAERSLLSAVTGVAATGRYSVVVIVPGQGPLVDECRRLGLEVIQQPYAHWARPSRPLRRVLDRTRTNLAASVALWRALRSRNVAAVCSNTVVVPVGALLAKLLGVPHVWHIREFVEEDFAWRFDYGRRVTMAVVARTAAQVICNSEAVASKFRPLLPRAPIRVVYNGFSFSETPSRGASLKYDECVARVAGGPVLLMLGAVSEAKGQHEAVQALGLLQARRLPARLLIAGDCEARYRQRLDSLCRESGISAAVTFVAFTADPAPLLHSAAATLVCSRSEAFGRTAVESMGAGTPVIAAAAGALPEVIEDGHTGLFYPKGDPAALADRIADLLGNEGLYRHVVTEGRRAVVQRFDLQRYVGEYVKVVDSVVSPAPSTG